MPSILIIDDDRQICSLLREAFEDGGYLVTVANDGQAGITSYREAPADLVILDILMPEKEGLETILELRRDFPSIKIIAMSGGSERAHINLLDLATRLGAIHTVSKPFEIRSLLNLAESSLKADP